MDKIASQCELCKTFLANKECVHTSITPADSDLTLGQCVQTVRGPSWVISSALRSNKRPLYYIHPRVITLISGSEQDDQPGNTQLVFITTATHSVKCQSFANRKAFNVTRFLSITHTSCFPWVQHEGLCRMCTTENYHCHLVHGWLICWCYLFFSRLTLSALRVRWRINSVGEWANFCQNSWKWFHS